MKTAFYTDPRVIADLRRRETAGAAPLYAAIPTVLTDLELRNHHVPLAFVDVRKRPDVADLWRVLRQEPDWSGDAVTAWRVLTQRGNSQAVLNIHWTAPVALHLRLVFSFQAHRPFLRLAAQTDMVLLTCRPPSASMVMPETITVQPEGRVVLDALMAVALMEARRR